MRSANLQTIVTVTPFGKEGNYKLTCITLHTNSYFYNIHSQQVKARSFRYKCHINTIVGSLLRFQLF